MLRISGPSKGSTSWYILKGKDGFLDTEVRDGFSAQSHFGEFFPEHDLSGDSRHGDVAYLGDEGHGAACSRIGFKDVDGVLVDGVLDVHQADDAQFDSDLAVVLVDSVDVFWARG